jgi:hypothetical protein
MTDFDLQPQYHLQMSDVDKETEPACDNNGQDECKPNNNDQSMREQSACELRSNNLLRDSRLVDGKQKSLPSLEHGLKNPPSKGTHVGLKCYSCNVCDFKTTRGQGLKNHVSYVNNVTTKHQQNKCLTITSSHCT